jgi:uracil-DNA glycosylase
MSAWLDHVNHWKDCMRCPLAAQRDNIVLARGSVPCDVLMIGEAPGASEDTLGLPFKGPAGVMLDNDQENHPGIVQRAIEHRLEWSETMRRNVWVSDVRIAYCNLVCCFPREAKARGDNEPEHDEIIACRPRLIEFVNIAQPRLIVCVGGLATEYIDHKDTVRCIDIVHPAAILAHMPAAQKSHAVNQCIVRIRTAVAVMLQSDVTFTQWGAKYADFTKGQGLKQRFDQWESHDLNLPF